MATHRSLNKLEFKAHMSIHNKVEVPENEAQGSHYTRDRFGKKQSVSAHSRPRRRSATKIPLIAALALLVLGAVPAEAARNTDVKIENGPLSDLLDTKFNAPEDRFGIPLGESEEISLNENGDPNLNVRF